ncbi:MAG: LysR family transcriptional regulator [Oscillospiraceae bacterium]|jgi:DNA-binding transcriptional LysR family regulator|nr:LysR family transcriptional regulator [Oscillospiraceae bacterium]
MYATPRYDEYGRGSTLKILIIREENEARRVTIDQLRYFVTCASIQSFRRAAFILYTSPSTVTRQLTSLETELGVKLFIRDTHSVRITDEGWIFYGYAMRALGTLDGFFDEMMSVGKAPPDNKPAFRVACYTSDGMFARIVRAVEQAFPSEQLSKPYKFHHPTAGEMVRAVLHEAYHVGVDSRAILEKLGGVVETQLLHSSPFRIIVGKDAPLFGRSSVSTREIVSRFGSFGHFIPTQMPAQIGDRDIRDRPIAGAAGLRALGEYMITRIPEVLPIFGKFDAPDDMMLLLPKELTFSHSKELNSVRLEDESIATDYMLFWKTGECDADLPRFLRLIARVAG